MIVVLTLASQQYEPRLVKNFIEDRPSQFVIGSFAACFIYNILILRNIHSGEVDFVPHLSILVAVLSAVGCIDYLATSLRAIALRPFPSSYRADAEEQLRLFRRYNHKANYTESKSTMISRGMEPFSGPTMPRSSSSSIRRAARL